MKLSNSGAPITILRVPVEPSHATNKKYVDDVLAGHANNTSLHMSFAQSDYVDSLMSVLPDVVLVSGLSENVQTQLDSKLAKLGGTLTGFLSLHANPTDPAHAVTKAYTDLNLSQKLDLVGGTLSGFLSLHANPTNPLHSATKQYVDSSLTTHANDGTLHVSPAESTWLSEVTATSTEVNQLSGVTSNVQIQLNDRLSKTGGNVTGDVTLTSDASILSNKVPSDPDELVNKAYVDFKVAGKDLKDSITTSTLVGFALNTPPAEPEEGVTYIVGDSPNGAWTGFSGYALQYQGTDWIALHGSRPVQPGDRFGVALKLTTPAETELAAHDGMLVTLVSGTPGNYIFQQDVLTAGATALVYDQDSLDFGDTYSYSDEGIWVITDTSVNLSAGNGLTLVKRALHVGAGPGIIVGLNDVQVNVNTISGLNIDGTGKVTLLLDGDSLTSSLTGLKLNAGLRSIIDDAVTKTGTSVFSGSFTVSNVGFLRSEAPALVPTDVITKSYADGIQTTLTGLISSLTTTVNSLNADPVTKTYVDTEVAKHVPLNGGTMTGLLTLSANPINNLHAVPKQYVDTNLNNHVNNTGVHITSAERDTLTYVDSNITAIGFITDLTSSAQNQLDNKLPLSGGTMTGDLVLYGAPTIAGHAVNKGYLDSQLTSKLSLSGGEMTGYLKLAGDPIALTDAVPLGYLNTRITAANDYADAAAAAKLDSSGGTLTGFLTLHADPTNNYHASTKKYVDDSVATLSNAVSISINSLQNRATALETTVSVLNADPVTKTYTDIGLNNKYDKAGGALTGFLTLHADPTSPMHAVTKQYVDAKVIGFTVKSAVRLATTLPLLANYDNGSDGVNATLTGQFAGALVADGKAAALGDRILVRMQSFSRENGDYVVDQVGDVGTPFILRRSTSNDEAVEIKGSYFNVFDGDTLKGTGWVLGVDDPSTFVLGTHAVRVNQFFGPGTYIAGAGMSSTGLTFNVNTASSDRIVVGTNDIDLSITGVVAGTYTKITVDAWGRATGGSNPTTIADYGITDAQPINTRLTTLGSLATKGLLVIDNSNSLTTRLFSVTGLGITINDDGTGSAASAITVSLNSDSANTANTLVFRDASGNFVANNITANLTGNASTATTLQTSRTFSIAGDVTATAQSFNGSGNVTLTTALTETGIAAGTYRSVTVDAKGRVTGGSNPTTIADYGLTDAQPLNTKLSTLGAISGRGLLVIDIDDVPKVRKIAVQGVGLSISDDGTAAATADLVIQSNATANNTPSTIVSRDASGNFTANMITAELNGNANSANQLSTSRNFSITGDIIASATPFNGTANLTFTTSLSETGVAAGTYRSVTVDAKGRVTSASNPTTIADYGITDAVTITELNNRVAELEAQMREMYNYMLSRM